jgi:hypothetical protein
MRCVYVYPLRGPLSLTIYYTVGRRNGGVLRLHLPRRTNCRTQPQNFGNGPQVEKAKGGRVILFWKWDGFPNLAGESVFGNGSAWKKRKVAEWSFLGIPFYEKSLYTTK